MAILSNIITPTNVLTATNTQTVTNKTLAAATNTIEARSAPNATSFGFRNRIINGDMRIDQRNAGAALTLTASLSGRPVDRIFAINQTDGTFTVQQSSVVPPGFTNSVVVTVTATDSSLGATQWAELEQRIEGFNVADLGWGTANAQAVTISFQVRSSLTGTFCVALYNSNASRCYVSTYTINAANTWESKTITVPGDTTGTWLTTNGIGINLIFTLAVGSTYQQAEGSWGTTAFAIGTSGQTNFLGTSGATFYITGVQLEAGTVATPFERIDYGRELMMCQRYFCKTYDTNTATGTATSSAWIGSQNGTNGISIFSWYFPVRMRASPTMTYQANGTGSLWYDSNGGFVMTPSTQRIGEQGVLIYVTGGNANAECAGHAFASAEL